MAQAHPFHLLQQIGLSRKDAAMYLALLEKPRVTVAELARDSNVKRPTCYAHLSSLMTKGLIAREQAGKHTYYSAIDPKQILAEYRKRVTALETGVEEMAQLRAEALGIPKIRTVSGKAGVAELTRELSAALGIVYALFPTHFFEDFDDEDATLWTQLDKQDARLLFSRDKSKKTKDFRAKLGFSKDKTLPKWFTCNTALFVLESLTCSLDPRTVEIHIIESARFAEMQRKLCESAWIDSKGQ